MEGPIRTQGPSSSPGPSNSLEPPSSSCSSRWTILKQRADRLGLLQLGEVCLEDIDVPTALPDADADDLVVRQVLTKCLLLPCCRNNCIHTCHARVFLMHTSSQSDTCFIVLAPTHVDHAARNVRSRCALLAAPASGCIARRAPIHRQPVLNVGS